jgi:uncharacterized protein YbbK (DUF523 family)
MTDKKTKPKRHPVILVSACLIGVSCRYDGRIKTSAAVLKLAKRAALVPVCPEQLGGLPTPRPGCQIVGSRVRTEAGEDRTAAYRRGAEAAADIADLVGAKTAVLKSKSPSCGIGQIKDGTFSGALKRGDGVTARLLRRRGLRLFDEHDVENGKI